MLKGYLVCYNVTVIGPDQVSLEMRQLSFKKKTKTNNVLTSLSVALTPKPMNSH